jgi:hypothetical protein
MPATRADMLGFAEQWIETVNRRDFDHLALDFAGLASHLNSTPLVEGEAARASYSRETFDPTLDRVVCDTDRQEMVVVFDRMVSGEHNRACAFMRFDEQGRAVSVEAMDGAKLA